MNFSFFTKHEAWCGIPSCDWLREYRTSCGQGNTSNGKHPVLSCQHKKVGFLWKASLHLPLSIIRSGYPWMRIVACIISRHTRINDMMWLWEVYCPSSRVLHPALIIVVESNPYFHLNYYDHIPLALEWLFFGFNVRRYWKTVSHGSYRRTFDC